jgi:hypothetical protein
MQSFKEFFGLYLERQYFMNNLEIFSSMVNELRNRINEVDEYYPGIEFYLDFDEDHTVKVALYDIIPPNIPKQHKNDDAIYNPADETIYVFLNRVIGVDKKNRLEVLKKFPKYLRDVVFHELSHAYEHMMREFEDDDKLPSVAHYTGPENQQIRSKNQRYINNLAELNAHFHQWISRELQDNKIIRTQIKHNNINNAAQLLVQKVKQEPLFKNLFEKNKKWFYKTIYTTLHALVE